MRTCPVDLKSDSAAQDHQSLLAQKGHRKSSLSLQFRDSLIRHPLHDCVESSQMDLQKSNLEVRRTSRRRTSSHIRADDSSDIADDDELSMEHESSPVPSYEELRMRLRNVEFHDGHKKYDHYHPPTNEDHRRRVVNEKSRFTGVPESLGTNHNPESSNNHTRNIVLGVIVIASLFGLLCYWNLNSKGTVESIPDEIWLVESLKNNIKIIGDSFPSQLKTIWPSFFSGIKKVLLEKPTEPSVFLLIHEGSDDISSCLARKVGSAAHKYLNASKPDPLIVDGQTLSKNKTLSMDYGHLISDYRPLVEEHRIMILNDLQLVPASLARGLHIFCDNITPLVHKAVYIFTLNISKGNDKGNPTKIAETELFSIWNQLDIDILSPLIARITGGFVFIIQPEESTKIC